MKGLYSSIYFIVSFQINNHLLWTKLYRSSVLFQTKLETKDEFCFSCHAQDTERLCIEPLLSEIKTWQSGQNRRFPAARGESAVENGNESVAARLKNLSNTEYLNDLLYRQLSKKAFSSRRSCRIWKKTFFQKKGMETTKDEEHYTEILAMYCE